MKNKFQALAYDIVFSTKFHATMAVVICLNIITLTLEYYNQPDFYDETFNIINTFFIAIFGLEICLQLYALRQHFFRNMMNVYSLLVTIICLTGIDYILS